MLVNRRLFLQVPFTTHDRIAQRAKLINANLNHVPGLQGKLFLRDDGRSCAEQNAFWEVIFKEEVGYQFIEATFQLSRACLPFPVNLVIALNIQANGKIFTEGCLTVLTPSSLKTDLILKTRIYNLKGYSAFCMSYALS